MGKNNFKSVDYTNAYQVVNDAYKQAVGASAVDTITLDDFCDKGVAFDSLTMARDQFTKALIDQVVNFYTDTELFDEYDDPYYLESRRFANVVQMLSMQPQEAQESHAWRDLSPSVDGGNIKYKTVGSYSVKPPQISAKYFQKSISYEIPLAITEEQYSDAFRSAEELRGFVDWVMLNIQNSLRQHRKDMTYQNRNAWVAEKLLYASSVGAKGIHKINLLTEFNAQRGGNLTTVADFFESPAACRFAAAQLQLYAKYLREQSSLFNCEGLVKFVPRDRLVLEVNSYFENALNETAYSDTFNAELLSLPLYRSVPAWQGFGITNALASTEAASFDQMSKIDVSVTGGDVEQSGIVAVMADKYAICHTIRAEYTASKYFDPEHLTLYFFQSRDQYMENLGQNGLVFTVEAPTT